MTIKNVVVKQMARSQLQKTLKRPTIFHQPFAPGNEAGNENPFPQVDPKQAE
jgi:hypothetical protein